MFRDPEDALGVSYSYRRLLEYEEEDLRRRVLYKQANGQLIIQKLKKILKHTLTPRELGVGNRHVIYGKFYQLRTSVNSKSLVMTFRPDFNLTETDRDVFAFSEPVAAPHKFPCVRNTIVFVSGDPNDDKVGSFVRYGDTVGIQVIDKYGKKYYLSVDTNSMGIFGHDMSLIITNTLDRYGLFILMSVNRKSIVGSNIIPRTNFQIRHVRTGRNLILQNTSVMGYFGVERLLGCGIRLDSRRNLSEENFWSIATHIASEMSMIVKSCRENSPCLAP